MRQLDGEFWRSVLAQGLGTVIGGAVLALFGVAVGVIDNVNWVRVGIALTGFCIGGLIGAFVATEVWHRFLRRRPAARRRRN